jgi:hypothetical protein
MRTLLLCWALGLPTVTFAQAPTEGTAKTQGTTPESAKRGAAALLVGEWQLLGPASQAETIRMMELTVATKEPTAEEFAAARLSPEAVAQVLDARERAKAGPDSPELQAMRRVIKELETARFTIDRDQIHARMGTTVDLLRYRVLTTEGPVITIEAISNSGQKSTLLLTLPEPDLLMFGPPAQEPLVLRRIKR